MTASAKAFGLLISVLFAAGAALAQEEGVSATGPVKLSLNVAGEYTDNRDALEATPSQPTPAWEDPGDASE